jgi:hypothetical protein
MSIWTDGLPAWWAMIVAVAALLAGVLLGELRGRGVGRGQVREDWQAERAVRQVRSWRDGPATREEAMAPRTHPVYRQRRPSTAAFLNPAVTRFDNAMRDHGRQVAPEVAHEAWLAHTEQAMDLANDGQGVHLAPADEAWLASLQARLDNWLDENVYSTEES